MSLKRMSCDMIVHYLALSVLPAFPRPLKVPPSNPLQGGSGAEGWIAAMVERPSLSPPPSVQFAMRNEFSFREWRFSNSDHAYNFKFSVFAASFKARSGISLQLFLCCYRLNPSPIVSVLIMKPFESVD